MISIQWCATSALKASTSATSPPHAAGPMGAGSDQGSSAQSVSGRFKLKASCMRRKKIFPTYRLSRS